MRRRERSGPSGRDYSCVGPTRYGPAGVFYGPPVASSARELFMLGGSWGYGPAGIPYGPSRIWVIGVSPHRTGRWWAGMIHSRTSLLCVGPERLNSLVLRGPWARSGSVFYAFLAHSSTRPKSLYAPHYPAHVQESFTGAG